MGRVDYCDQLLRSCSIHGGKKYSTTLLKCFLSFWISVWNACIIFSILNPQQKSNRSHRYFREVLMHEIVQPLLSARSDLENPEEKTVGRPSNIDAVRLPEKHFPVSRYPTKKTCNVCGCKKNTKWKQARKKTNNFCEKFNLSICKKCFEE